MAVETRPNIKRLVYLNGRPSTGKDTQADKLAAEFGAVRESTGDMGRMAREGKEPYAKYHDKFAPYYHIMDAGGMIPDEVIIPAVQDRLTEHFEKGVDMIIFTGFPRTIGQLEAVDGMEDELERTSGGIYTIKSYHVALVGLEKTSIERAAIRRAQGVKRPDDAPEVVERRLKSYKGPTEAAIRKLVADKRIALLKANRPIEPIYDDLKKLIMDEEPTHGTMHDQHHTRHSGSFSR